LTDFYSKFQPESAAKKGCPLGLKKSDMTGCPLGVKVLKLAYLLPCLI